MSKSASICSRLVIFRLPRSAKKGQHFQTGWGKKTGATAQPLYNGFRVICDRVIMALQCILFIFFQITGFDSHVNYLTDDSMNCQVLLFREKHNKQEMFYMLSLDF